MALIVCMRFSACSKAMFSSDSKTSSVTSMRRQAELLVDVPADLGLGVVKGGQAMHEFDLRIPGRLHQLRD